MRRKKQFWAVLTQEVILRKPVHEFHICCQFDVFGPMGSFILPYHPLRETSKGSIHLLGDFLGLNDTHHGAQGHKDKTRVSKLGDEILKFLERGKKGKERGVFQECLDSHEMKASCLLNTLPCPS